VLLEFENTFVEFFVVVIAIVVENAPTCGKLLRVPPKSSGRF
jgi:hypothetical protein